MQIHQVAKLAVAGLLRGTDRAAACVVHQHIDAAMPVEHLGDGGADTVGVRDIERQCGDAFGRRRHQVRKSVRASRGGDDNIACDQCGLGDRAAEARTRPGDQPYPRFIGCHASSMPHDGRVVHPFLALRVSWREMRLRL
jgi:hypothetical protein